MTTGHIRRVLIAVALAASTISVARAGNDESKECSVADVRGLYVFAASGFDIVGGVAQPKAIVEEIQFDGEGSFTVPAATVSRDGVILHSPPNGTGTYTVEPNCTGTLVFAAGPTFDLFVAPSRSELHIIQTNQGSVLQGALVRIRRD